MPDVRNILLLIITPLGPTLRLLTKEELNDFIKAHNLPIDLPQEKTPIPKVFQDAFKQKEE